MFKDSGDKIDTPMVIGPKATIFSDAVTWDADQLATIQTGEKILFVWGRARYKDRFEDTTIHRTRFVYKIWWRGDPQHPNDPLPLFFIPLHDKFNCADEECERQEQEQAKDKRLQPVN